MAFSLDVVLPTFNRAALLAKALDSLAAASIPEGLHVTVYVVDNNSTDRTAEVVKEYQDRLPVPLRYIRETIQGSSSALNAGISAGTGDIVAMINDDEEIDCRWFEVIQEFAETSFDFAGGPYRPNWEVEKPDWISKESGGIVGWVDAGDTRQEYGPNFAGMLMGGNALIRRRVLDQIGPYEVSLGRTGKGLMSCEDELMYRRLIAAGFRGIYLPELVVYHFIPAERLTRRYHRRWCWGLGNSLAVLAGLENKPEAHTVLGIPRWRFRYAIVGLLSVLAGLFHLKSPQAAFQGELRLWTLAGLINGHFSHRPRSVAGSRSPSDPEPGETISLPIAHESRESASTLLETGISKGLPPAKNAFSKSANV
jgi:glycosyltransferase involved in cell wall biosynthesis